MSRETSRRKWKLARRSFLGLAGAGLAGAAVSNWDRIRRFFQASNAPSVLTALRGKPDVIYSICDNCVNKCGIKAYVSDGKLVKLDPNPHFPKSRSMLCAKGNAGVKVVYDPDRLKHPMIRTGERGSGQWRQATWEEALDYTAKRLGEIKQKYGPQGVLFSSSEAFQEKFFLSFARAFGSPNTVRHPSLCLTSGNLGFFMTYGTVPEYDIENSQYVILSGANRFESFITPDSIDMMEVMRRRKAKLIYLDPRYTVTASKADEWLPIRPGADLAFYLALIHVLIKENLYNRSFVDTYTQGIEELTAHIENYTPEWAARETEIPAERIRSIAREFAYYAPRAVIYRGRRSSWYSNDTEMRQAMAIANALVGNWDQPGGLLPAEKLEVGSIEPPEYPWPDVSRVDNIAETHPLSNPDDGTYVELRQNILADKPYPVRGWVIYKQNPMHALPDRKLTEQMFRKMEFVVAIDIMPTDSAWMADVILPESTYLERLDPVEGFNAPYPFLALRQQVISPIYDTRSCLEIVKGLAKRMELSEYFNFDIHQYIAAQLAPQGLTEKDFRSKGIWTNRTKRNYGTTLTPDYRFKTPSGKIELASERLRRQGLYPLPAYAAPAQPPADKFRLLPGKQAIFTHAANQNNEWLHELEPENHVWIHSAAASGRGISNNDPVIVRSPVGEVTIRAYVTDRIRQDCVHIPHGFGHRSPALRLAHGKGASDQDLIEARWDRLSGNAAMHETFVSVEKA